MMLDKFGNPVVVRCKYNCALQYKVFSAASLGDAGVIILQQICADGSDGDLHPVSPSEFVNNYFVVNFDRDGIEIKYERYNNDESITI